MPKAALLIISLLSLSLHAQNNALVKEKDVLEFRKLSIQRLGQDALDTTKWDLGGNFGIQFTQASYSNWQAGGVNSIAGNSIFNGFANYIGKGKWVWSNAMTLAYGVNFQDTIFNKTPWR